MNKRILALAAGFVSVLAAFSQTHADTLMMQLKDPDCKKVFVVSHRGDWRNAPENSLQAIKNCIDMGVDMVEIDLKMTKDGELILMHDNTINRTTSGKGEPKDFTLKEIKKMVLRNGAGHRTEHQVPTLEEALLVAKGKILVNIDKGYEYFNQVSAILEKTGTANQVVIKDGKPYEIVREEKGEVLDKMVFMPVLTLTHDKAKEHIEGYVRNYKPVLYECNFADDNKQVYNMLNLVKKSGCKIFINSLWPELCGGHNDDRAVERGEYDQSWGWILKRGASLIQTDRPAIMLEWLRKQGLHE